MGWRILTTLCLAASWTLAAEAPIPVAGQFQGPNRNGDYGNPGILTRWPPSGPRELWRRPVGKGFSAPVAAGDRVYVQSLDGERDALECLDLATGRPLWRASLEGAWNCPNFPGPRSTPLVVDGRVLALTAKGRLHAFAAKDGALVWQVSFVDDLKGRVPTWGYAGSPLYADGLVYVEAGGQGAAMAAIDLQTGTVRWSRGEDPSGYGSARLAEIGGVRQVLFFTGRGMVAADPSTGKELWRHFWRTAYDVNCTNPIVWQDAVLISSGYGSGCALLKPGEGSATVLWKSRALASHVSSPILRDGHVYGVHGQLDGPSVLRCLDLATGTVAWEKTWEDPRFGSAHLIQADGQVLVLGNEGTLVLVEVNPKCYVEKGRCKAISGRSWCPMSLHGTVLVLRSDTEIVAFDIAKGGKQGADQAATIYESWPFAADEARTRQEDTAKTLGIPVRRSLDLGGGVLLELALIPAGAFVMGSPPAEAGRDPDEVAHPVRITKPFYLGIREVTQPQWQALMGDNPSSFPGSDLPVEKVDWRASRSFCEKLALKHGVRCRLPTEAEWEYACRAGSSGAFAAGDGPEAIRNCCWCSQDGTWGSAGKTRPVASLTANAWGLYDMHGNVGEWCLDADDAYARSAGPVDDPVRDDPEAPAHVVRGGSWFLGPDRCRSASRCGFHADYRDVVVGLRVAIGTE